MKQIEIEDRKKIEVELLDFIVDFCEKNQISYWLDRGSLIGAARHRGFIPWDDDIDIGMLREDYDKFIQEFHDPKGRYVLKCGENDDDFPIPFGKVLDTTTILFEPDMDGLKIAVNIDILPLDSCPSDERQIRRMYKRRDIYKFLCNIQAKSVRAKKSYKRIIVGLLSLLLRPLPRCYFSKKTIENATSLKDKASQYVGDFTSIYYIKSKREWFLDFTELEFEGKMYRVPIGYDNYLRDMYGDYMQYPPIEKRNSGHQVVAYYK